MDRLLKEVLNKIGRGDSSVVFCFSSVENRHGDAVGNSLVEAPEFQ